jgi:SAM-dependent methyltransferase
MSKKFECALCGSRADCIYKIDKFKKDFHIYKCDSCGFQMQLPYPDSAAISAMYGRGYYEGEADFSYIDERRNREASAIVYRARVVKLMKKLKRPKTSAAGFKWLDIGCSFGGLLDCAESAGFKPVGVELSDFAREKAGQFLPGAEFHKDLFDAEFTAESFSAVSMIEVIEHLTDPVSYVREIFRVLEPGGVFLLQTADMSGRQAVKNAADYHYYLPGHLSYFSAANLKNLLKSCGFSKVKIYRPVEFGLLPKLRKIAATEQGRLKILKKQLQTSMYHIKGFVHIGDFALTSSMVIHAVKSAE